MKFSIYGDMQTVLEYFQIDHSKKRAALKHPMTSCAALSYQYLLFSHISSFLGFR
jgi:hypothetical protein